MASLPYQRIMYGCRSAGSGVESIAFQRWAVLVVVIESIDPTANFHAQGHCSTIKGSSRTSPANWVKGPRSAPLRSPLNAPRDLPLPSARRFKELGVSSSKELEVPEHLRLSVRRVQREELMGGSEDDAGPLFKDRRR